MATHISKSPEATLELGRRWGREAEPGQVIGLEGDLGSGKTQLVKGIAQGLGITARVHSPSFALLHEYGGGRLVLHHLDLYRLRGAEEVISAGLEEFCVRPPGLAVVEWISRWTGTLDQLRNGGLPPARLRWVHLEILDETTRRIDDEDLGP